MVFFCKVTNNRRTIQILSNTFLQKTLAESKIMSNFAPSTLIIYLNIVLMKKKKAENCVKSGKMLGSVEHFNYFCR
jgi:hypothetical protein